MGSVWYVFNPTSQVQGWKEKGWLGEVVAGAIQRTGSGGPSASAAGPGGAQRGGTGMTGKVGSPAPSVGDDDEVTGASTIMGNKWQTAGAFAVDGRGSVIWGGKALRADDPMDLDAGVAALGL